MAVMKNTLPLPFYLLWPARFLPKKIRGGIGLAALGLLLGMKFHEIRQWLKNVPRYWDAGNFMRNGPLSYERVWPNVRGQAPVDEILEWFHKAVHTGPSAYGFGVSVYAGNTPLGEQWRFRLSEFPQVKEKLQQFLLTERFDEEEEIALLVTPFAAFAGVPLRPLPSD